MDREKVKFLIQSMEVLIDELKAEVYTDAETHKVSETAYSDESPEVSTNDLIYQMYAQQQVMSDEL